MKKRAIERAANKEKKDQEKAERDEEMDSTVSKVLYGKPSTKKFKFWDESPPR